MNRVTRKKLLKLYERMAEHYGTTHWWPGDSAFEIAVGAILTQNTAWTNVERAIENIKKASLMNPKAIMDCRTAKLEKVLVPSGYFRVKAKRVRNFCAYLLDNYGGSMKKMAKRPLEELRQELLEVNGIGSETADDILLYACEKPVFVVDAYTRRILHRHGLVSSDIPYEELRSLFENNLDSDVHLFKEYHGLIVWTGKDFCKRTPKCEACPLGPKPAINLG